MDGSLGNWDPLAPVEVASLFAGRDLPWWIAGGWAIDLFLGRHTRYHDDIDVEIPRYGTNRIAEHLADWEFHLAKGGKLWPWDGISMVPQSVNSLWCRQHKDGPWRLQIMLATTRGAHWVYRRDARIERVIESLVMRDFAGIPYLAPEVQILFKSKDIRPKDEADFRAVHELLDTTQRAWLVAALELTSPGHRWIATLAE